MTGVVELGEPWEWRTQRARGAFAGQLRLRAAAVGDVVVASVEDDSTAEDAEEALRRQRDALRDSQRRYAALAENLPDIVSRWDGSLRIVYINSTVGEVTGLPPERWVGRTLGELEVPAEVVALWRERLQAIFEGRGEQQFVFELPTPGGPRALESRVVPEPAPDGSIPYALAVTRDVTDSRRALAGLRAREAQEAAMRRAATAVARETRPQRIFGAVSREAAALLGLDAGLVLQIRDGGARAVGSWSAGPVEPVPLPPDELFTGQSAEVRAARSGRPERVDDYAALDDPTARRRAAAGHACAVAAPIWHGAALWGVVAAVGGRPGAIPPRAEALLADFASLAGLAVVNAEAREELIEQALTDHLTGLANRRAFSERLEGELARAERHGHPLSLVVLDLDHFKRVNDRRGHEVGDRVLVEVARRLRSESRRGELVARVGGEEFAWILPGSDMAGGVSAAERARARVAAAPIPGVGTITVSAGVAALCDGESGQDLLRDADRALYEAKAAGRNRTVSARGD
jgi:diguanylate cyclase (GGDEF)-like protein/PAS domain S-box-containing protein